jgi:uncharacterized membrane protein YeaQ/YmgE (transglycosylase-associated protein family)
MSLIVALIIGGIVGWVAAAVTGRNEGIVGSVAIGIVGSIIGSILAGLFSSGNTTYFSFTWAGLAWSFVGAIIFAAILNTLQHRSTTHHNL